MNKAFSLTGRIALVTGASSGIGAGTARVLAGMGASVACVARRKDRLTELVEQIEKAGGRALAVQLDVTDTSAIGAAFDQIEAQLGVVDLLVNNAGITGAIGPYEDYPTQSWNEVIDLNLNAVHHVSQEASRRMIKAGTGGSIINIASIAAIRAAGHYAAYSASKAGTLYLTKTIALELIKHGIRVNAVCPGVIASEIMSPDVLDSDVGKAMITHLPAGRVGQPEDIGNAVAFLASPAASFIVGEHIVVDGGQTIQIPGFS